MSELWIDVSVHNGTIDWNKVKSAGVKGVVIRAGYGSELSQIDGAFIQNITGAIKAGLQIAVYWFHYADTISKMQQEWNVCKQIISPYKDHILFVASDYEYDTMRYYKKLHGVNPNNALVNQLVNTFLQAVTADGYTGWLYSNNDYRKNVFTADTWNRWPIWLADYTGSPDVSCKMQQTGSSGSVNGIIGSVDMDTLFEPFKQPDPPYTCDTSGTVTISMGGCYTAKTSKNVTLQVGKSATSARLQLIRCIWPNFILWHIVPLGNPGQAAGIYFNGKRQFVVRIR